MVQIQIMSKTVGNFLILLKKIKKKKETNIESSSLVCYLQTNFLPNILVPAKNYGIFG